MALCDTFDWCRMLQFLFSFTQKPPRTAQLHAEPSAAEYGGHTFETLAGLPSVTVPDRQEYENDYDALLYMFLNAEDVNVPES